MEFCLIIDDIVMERWLKYIGVLALLIMQSCSSTQKINIMAKPGTIIYTPDMEMITTVTNSGVSEIEIPKDETFPYLLSQEKIGDRAIPFALDYENRKCNGPKILEGVCMGLAFPSAVAMCVGTILVAVTGDAIALAVGAGVALPSCFVGMVANERSNYDQNHYRYRYLQEQKTNHDIVFSPLKQTANYKTLYMRDESEQNNDTTSGDIQEEQIGGNVYESNSYNDAVKNRNESETSNYSQVIDGTYYGTGELMVDNDVVEKYDNMKIVIYERPNNMVRVDVFTKSTIQYFSDINIYNISKTNNEYRLHHTTNDSFITIDDRGELIFTYGNITNRGYVLKIKADKK